MLATAHDSELDHGATKVVPGMERHCALSRTLKPVDEMIRFGGGPGDETVPDIKRKLRVAADLPATTERLLERSALDALAIAGKAGQVVGGFTKVEAAIGCD